MSKIFDNSKAIELLLEHSIDVRSDSLQLIGPVDANMFRRASNGLAILNRVKRQRPITVILSTYGGEVDYGFAIYELIKRNPRQAHVHAIGPCMSAGTLILQAGVRRLAAATASFLCHYGSSSAESREEVNHNDLQHTQWVDLIYERVSRAAPFTSKADVQTWHDAEKYFMAEEALTVGLIDEVA